MVQVIFDQEFLCFVRVIPVPTEMEAQVPLLDEAFKTFSSLTYVTLFLKGRKVQSTQRLFHGQV